CALAHECQGPRAIHALGALRALVSVGLEVAGDVHVDTAQRVHQALDAVEVDQGHMVDRHARVVLDRVDRQAHSAEGEGRVDPVPAVPGDLHVHVTGEGHHVHVLVVVGDVHQHHHVRALAADPLGGGVLLGPLVRTQQQEVAPGAVDVLGPLTVGGPAGDADDITFLVRVAERLHVAADHHTRADHHHGDEPQPDQCEAAAPAPTGFGGVAILPVGGQ